MSDKIKPSEVSQVLLDQLKGISDAEKFDEVGTVLTVSDGVARIYGLRIYGLRNAEANELLEFENGTMAIVMNLEEDNVGCVLLGTTSGIKEGMVVKRTKRIASIRVNDNMLGRVINPLGQAIDGKGDIDLSDAFEMPLDRKAPGVIYRQPVKEPSSATARRVRPPSPLIPSSIRRVSMRQVSLSIVSMWPSDRRPVLLLLSFLRCRSMVLCLTPSWLLLQLPIQLLCSTMHHLQELLSASISAIEVCQHSWFTTTCRSRLWPIVRYR